MYVYYGEGMDETTGLAALGDVLLTRTLTHPHASPRPNPRPNPNPNPNPNQVLAISGHFAGNLSAERTDGSVATILNSNTAPGPCPCRNQARHGLGAGSAQAADWPRLAGAWGSPEYDLALGEASGASWPRSEPPVVFHTGELPDPADQFHAAGGGSQHTGVDDGFVIKASATTGKAEWIKHYPESNRDAQVVGVDVDASGNVFGSGYSCFSMWSKRRLRGAPQLATPIP